MFFDGTGAQLTDGVVRDLYGMESDEAGVGAAPPTAALKPVAKLEMAK